MRGYPEESIILLLFPSFYCLRESTNIEYINGLAQLGFSSIQFPQNFPSFSTKVPCPINLSVLGKLRQFLSEVEVNFKDQRTNGSLRLVGKEIDHASNGRE